MIAEELLNELKELLLMNESFGFDQIYLKEEIESLDYYAGQKDDLAIAESIVKKVGDKIRQRWIEKTLEKCIPLYKSPPSHIQKILPSGREIHFDYERCMEADEQEEAYYQNIDGWNGFGLFFSSAMSAMTTFLHSFRSFYKNQTTVRIVNWGSYFEISTLLDTFRSSQTMIETVQSDRDIIQKLCNAEDIDLYIIEPLRYNWDLDVLKIENLIEAIKSHPNNKLTFILLDTTLYGASFSLQSILNNLSSIKNIIFIELRSLLKLDQQGFELTNMGTFNIYIRPEHSNLLKKLQYFLKRTRAVMGTNISFSDLCKIDHPLFTSINSRKSYTEKVLKNNSEFARSIKPGNLIQRIVHPVLKGNEDSSNLAPFVFICLHQDRLEDYQLLVNILKYRFEKANSNLEIGASFGFRFTRMEHIVTLEVEPRSIIKVAVGKTKGFTYSFLIDVLNELNQYRNIQECRELYSFLSKEIITDRKVVINEK